MAAGSFYVFVVVGPTDTPVFELSLGDRAATEVRCVCPGLHSARESVQETERKKDHHSGES